MYRERTLVVAYVTAIAVSVLLIGWLASPVEAIPMPTHGIRPLDQPRCFPPGTLGAGNFLACPDGLPDMKAT